MSAGIWTSYNGYMLYVTAETISVYDKGVEVAVVKSMPAARAKVKELRRLAREAAA